MQATAILILALALYVSLTRIARAIHEAGAGQIAEEVARLQSLRKSLEQSVNNQQQGDS